HALGRVLSGRVVADLAEAKRLLETEPGTALAYYQNAFALHRLSMDVSRHTGKPGAAPLDKDIVAGMRTALARLQQGWATCHRCKGTGRQDMVLKQRDGHEVKGPKTKCTSCDGRGRRPGRVDPAHTKAAVLRGANTFMKNRLAAGDEKLGRVCLPVGCKHQLSNRQKALVLSAIPAPCPECGRSGREPCPKCRGTGLTRCTANGCQKGRVQERRKSTHGVVRSTRITDHPFTDLCSVCSGTGEVPCGFCNGTAGQPCRKCGGSGEAQTCRKCAGSGIVTCNKCKGVGDAHGKRCADCRGEGEVLCSSCQGDGTK
ncbi:MAG: hypothetical protein J6Z49_01965, partial [Kiritimatiellae bacterium]|nr:hypothetical protein [Kiritimatiellia bacterium]